MFTSLLLTNRGRAERVGAFAAHKAVCATIEIDRDTLTIHFDDPAHMIQLGEKIAAEGRRLLVEDTKQTEAAIDALTAEQVEESFSRR